MPVINGEEKGSSLEEDEKGKNVCDPRNESCAIQASQNWLLIQPILFFETDKNTINVDGEGAKHWLDVLYQTGK